MNASFFGSMRAFLVLLLASLTVFIISISHVHASMVTFKFEGELTSVDSTLSETFSTGDRFAGTYTFNSELPSDNPDSDITLFAEFSNAVSAMSFVSGTYTASSTNGDIVQDFETPAGYSVSFEPVSGSALVGFEPNDISLFWVSPDFADHTMPVDDPDFLPFLSPEIQNPFDDFFDAQGNVVYTPTEGAIGDLNQPLFDENGNPIPLDENGDFNFSFVNDDQQSVSIGGKLTSVTVVPIPAAVWLFGTGLLGLIGFTKRKQVL